MLSLQQIVILYLIVYYYLSCKIQKYAFTLLQKPKFILLKKYLLSPKGIQIILRFTQNTLYLISQTLSKLSKLPNFNIQIFHLLKLIKFSDQYANLMSQIRMINRFIVSPQLMYNFKKDYDNFKGKSKQNRTIYELFGLVADFFNVLFYITDHVIAFYSLDLYQMENSQDIISKATLYLNYFWMMSSIFYVIQFVIGIYDIKMKKKQENINQKFTFKLLVYNIIRNILQAICAYACINQQFMGMQLYGFFGQLICVCSYLLY